MGDHGRTGRRRLGSGAIRAPVVNDHHFHPPHPRQRPRHGPHDLADRDLFVQRGNGDEQYHVLRVYFASFSSILMLLIETGLSGRSFSPLGAVAILSTVSIPSMTLPKAVYWLSRWGESPCMMKNWLPAELGSWVRAAESTPRAWWVLLNSCLSL